MAPDPSLTPEQVHARAFTVGFRGYDQSEVRDFLNRLSTEIRSLREQVEQLESNWRSAEERAARPPVLDEETLMSAVGEETAAILRTARASAAELRNKAAEDADRIRHEAGGLLADKTKEAEESAARIVDDARAEAARTLEKAQAEAEEIRAKAEQDRALTIDGANSTRERILEDLSRRRRVATVQIEQLRAGRERLLESYAVVRRTLEEAQEELSRADAEARAAADEVGRKLNRELDPEALAATEYGDTGSGAPGGSGAAGGSGATGRSGAAGGSGATGGQGGTDATGGTTGSAANGGSSGSAPGGSGSSNGRGVAIAAAVEHPSAGLRNEEDRQDTVPHLRVLPDLAAGERETETPPDEGAEAEGMAAQELEAEVIAAQQGAEEEPVSAQAPAQEESGASGGTAPAGRSAATSPVDQLFAKIRSGRGNRSVAPAKEAPAEEAPAEEAPATEVTASRTAPDQAPSKPGPTDLPSVPAAGEAKSAQAPEPSAPVGDEAWLQKREEAISNLEVSLTRKLKRALQDEQNDILDRLRGLRSEVTAAVLLPATSSHKDRYTNAALPLVVEAADAGAAFAANVLGGGAGAGTPDVAPIADEAAEAIVGPLRRRLEQAIAVGASEDQAVLIESLGAAYREWKSQRVERVSGDALFAAFSRGTWHAVPDGAPMRWIVDDVDGPCPDCDDDALAGGLPKGEAFPTGQAHPPAHTGCRCLLVPVKD